ncbi:helix-turn-helix transcriptional regulator [Serratia marcescens]|nr:helix-turn-helix transcriptional regulator [Serratia marcescens]MBH2865741.1 helix-turn-helix transcriptional regulator [Serratia marcescens]MBW4239675.1 helix-turn-helix transcriptional regulator [Enterobacter roggenkampii]
MMSRHIYYVISKNIFFNAGILFYLQKVYSTNMTVYSVNFLSDIECLAKIDGYNQNDTYIFLSFECLFFLPGSFSFPKNKVFINEFRGSGDANYFVFLNSVKCYRNVFHLLSPRELQCFNLFLNGINDIDISKKMGVSIKTIYTHKRNIRLKLNISNRIKLSLLTLNRSKI